MKPRHQVSKAAIEMIKRFEGYRRKAARLPDGRWTLGYGHVLTARAGAEVSEADAEALLLYDLIEVAHAVNELTLSPLNRNQFDALCSFVFNIGVENYRASVVLQRLNEGQVLDAASAMEAWRRADVQGRRIVVDALVRRRAAEKTLFLTPPDGWIPASTPLMPPRHDDDMEALPPVLAEPDAEPEPSGTASERAAAAVGARLQQIFPEPEPPAGPVLRLTPAPEFDIEPELQLPADDAVGQDGPTLFDVAPPPEESSWMPAPATSERIVMAKTPSTSFTWGAAALPILLAIFGLAVTAGALFWGFYAQSTFDGLDPRVISWVGGLAGASMMAFAAYLALRRLGGPDAD
jgi:lysozyme